MTAPTTNQNAFHGREDDAGETDSTFKGSADSDFSQDVDTKFRCRFVIQETAGGMAQNLTPQLRYNLASAGWNDVNASSSVVQSVASSTVVDGIDTTQQVGGGTFVTTNAGFDEVDGLSGTINLQSNEFECEFNIQIIGADVANDQTLQLQVTNGVTDLSNYASTPTITVIKAAAADQPYNPHAQRMPILAQ